MIRIIAAVGVLLLCSISTGAGVTPIDCGSVILGTSIYYKYYENQSYDRYSSGKFMLKTNVGSFLASGFMVGANIDVAFSGSETVFGFGPAIGYYANANPRRREIRGSVYLNFKIFFRFAKANKGSTYELCPGAAIGIDKMISDALAIDIGILVSSDKIHARWGSSSRTMTMRVGAGIVSFIY